MKGFIEVTCTHGDVIYIRVDTIVFFRDNFILQMYPDGTCHNDVKESYEQIKELIKQAQ